MCPATGRLPPDHRQQTRHYFAVDPHLPPHPPCARGTMPARPTWRDDHRLHRYVCERARRQEVCGVRAATTDRLQFIDGEQIDSWKGRRPPRTPHLRLQGRATHTRLPVRRWHVAMGRRECRFFLVCRDPPRWYAQQAEQGHHQGAGHRVPWPPAPTPRACLCGFPLRGEQACTSCRVSRWGRHCTPAPPDLGRRGNKVRHGKTSEATCLRRRHQSTAPRQRLEPPPLALAGRPG